MFSDLFTLYLDVFGADLLRYVLGAGGTYLILNVLLSSTLGARKIRSEKPQKGQIRRELVASFRTVLVFAATGTGIALGERWGIVTIYTEIAAYGIGYLLFSVALLIVLHDAWFYWSHRLLHDPRLFRRFHRLHHRSHHPTPFTSYSFDVGEAVVNAAYLPLILLVLPAHPLALFVFVTHMMLRNALGHCGIEIFPARADGRPLIGWLSSVTHHDMHHAHAGYNFGLYFTWWDRLMGTEHPRYLATFARSAPRLERPRVAIAFWCVLLMSALAALPSAAGALKGHYASPGLDVIVEFAPCAGDTAQTCGYLKWLWSPEEAKHARIGDPILQDLRVTEAGWSGILQDPESGRKYRGTLRQIAGQRLELKGCAGPICRRQIWHSTKSLSQVLAQF